MLFFTIFCMLQCKSRLQSQLLDTNNKVPYSSRANTIRFMENLSTNIEAVHTTKTMDTAQNIVTSISLANYQSIKIIQNFSNTYSHLLDKVDETYKPFTEITQTQHQWNPQLFNPGEIRGVVFSPTLLKIAVYSSRTVLILSLRMNQDSSVDLIQRQKILTTDHIAAIDFLEQSILVSLSGSPRIEQYQLTNTEPNLIATLGSNNYSYLHLTNFDNKSLLSVSGHKLYRMRGLGIYSSSLFAKSPEQRDRKDFLFGEFEIRNTCPETNNNYMSQAFANRFLSTQFLKPSSYNPTFFVSFDPSGDDKRLLQVLSPITSKDIPFWTWNGAQELYFNNGKKLKCDAMIELQDNRAEFNNIRKLQLFDVNFPLQTEDAGQPTIEAKLATLVADQNQNQSIRIIRYYQDRKKTEFKSLDELLPLQASAADIISMWFVGRHVLHFLTREGKLYSWNGLHWNGIGTNQSISLAKLIQDHKNFEYIGTKFKNEPAKPFIRLYGMTKKFSFALDGTFNLKHFHPHHNQLFNFIGQYTITDGQLTIQFDRIDDGFNNNPYLLIDALHLLRDDFEKTNIYNYKIVEAKKHLYLWKSNPDVYEVYQYAK